MLNLPKRTRKEGGPRDTGRRRSPAAVWTAAAVLALSLVSAGAARADLALDLVWTSTTGSGVTGSNVIDAVPGDVLELDVIATVDAAVYTTDGQGNLVVVSPGGVDNYSLSVEFDLAGLDELDLLDAIEFDHTASVDCDPLIEEQLGPFPACYNDFGNELVNATPGIADEIESEPGFTGLAAGFEAGADMLGPGAGVSNMYFRVGRLVFLVTDNVATNGDDIEGSLLVNMLDGYLDDSLSLLVLTEDMPNPHIVPGFAAVNVPEPDAGLLAGIALATLAVLRSARRRVAGPRA